MKRPPLRTVTHDTLLHETKEDGSGHSYLRTVRLIELDCGHQMKLRFHNPVGVGAHVRCPECPPQENHDP